MLVCSGLQILIMVFFSGQQIPEVHLPFLDDEGPNTTSGKLIVVFVTALPVILHDF